MSWEIIGKIKFNKVKVAGTEYYFFYPPKYGEVIYFTSSFLVVDKIRVCDYGVDVWLHAPEELSVSYIDANITDYIELTLCDVCFEEDLIKTADRKYTATFTDKNLCQLLVERIKKSNLEAEIEVEF